MEDIIYTAHILVTKWEKTKQKDKAQQIGNYLVTQGRNIKKNLF